MEEGGAWIKLNEIMKGYKDARIDMLMRENMQIKVTWKLSSTLFSGTVLSLCKEVFNLCIPESKKKKKGTRQKLIAHHTEQ